MFPATQADSVACFLRVVNNKKQRVGMFLLLAVLFLTSNEAGTYMG